MKRIRHWQPPYDFIAARPTFVDAWPQAWSERAPPTRFVPLDRTECNALGFQIAGCRDWFEPASATQLTDLVARLDEAIEQMGRSCFVRLVSRSPKDSPRAHRRGLRVTNAADAMALFLEGSQRCAADLRMALDHHAPMALIVRPWLEFPDWCELRCFMRACLWVGASQAHTFDAACFPDDGHLLPQLLIAAQRTMADILASTPMDNAVFDLACITDDAGIWHSILLDANPLLPITDLALYATPDDFDDCCRIRCAASGTMHTVPLPRG